ncbi:4-amino-4-deoxychorismate lyase [Corynebacterium deserti GIMN1.010]|uniref:4-amino-4-deoxychorismate lyase n=1 Tax=Corynebacterium deserti GIMN1.010 TaxID=931089 RepID=A0A0M4CYX8_9CORY|nr:aminodeoxychorismate lyase [Corynebacterium deserti]ALC06700.1 4-amino-4-deoxychorismate lyase [Corynebacterium deserti GIMN1.010]
MALDPKPRSTPSPVILVVEPYGGSIRHQNPNLPMVFWDDAALTRGDGIFETILIRDGKACNLQRHSERFKASAALLGLPEPILEGWHKATEMAIEEWYAHPSAGDASCTWTLSRGRASTGLASGWLTVTAVSAEKLAQRENGVSVMTSSRGYSVDTDLPGIAKATRGEVSKVSRTPAPWLTVGAKTLAYAANMAALRYATANGFDDVIFTEDDRVLEGATSTVVSFKGDKIRTPAPGGDILPGTTQAALFDYATEHGWRCKEKDLTMDHLFGADSVWLVSSVRIAARVTRLDGYKLPKPDNEKQIRDLITKALG